MVNSSLLSTHSILVKPSQSPSSGPDIEQPAMGALFLLQSNLQWGAFFLAGLSFYFLFQAVSCWVCTWRVFHVVGFVLGRCWLCSWQEIIAKGSGPNQPSSGFNRARDSFGQASKSVVSHICSKNLVVCSRVMVFLQGTNTLIFQTIFSNSYLTLWKIMNGFNVVSSIFSMQIARSIATRFFSCRLQEAQLSALRESYGCSRVHLYFQIGLTYHMRSFCFHAVKC